MDEIEKQCARACDYLLKAADSDYIGESVSQVTHSLQCAYFAKKNGHSEEVILASLFHDIGHYAYKSKQKEMNGLGVINHEWITAKLLYEMGFSLKTAMLAGFHVESKRYLAAKKPRYYEKLSEASRGTLHFQGGPMKAKEQVFFEALPYFKECLQVRANDEKGKVVDLSVPQVAHFHQLIVTHIKKQIDKKRKNKKKFMVLAIKGKKRDMPIDVLEQNAYDVVLVAPKIKQDWQWPWAAVNKQLPVFCDHRLATNDEPLMQIYWQELQEEMALSVHDTYLILADNFFVTSLALDEHHPCCE